MRHHFLTLLILCISMGMAACDVTTPSKVKTGQMRLVEDTKTVLLNAEHIDERQIDMIADDYKRNGKSDLSVLVSYAANHPLDEMTAKKQASAYKAAFEKHKLSGVHVNTVAVAEKEAGRAVVSYMAVMATPPKDCGRITGYMGAETVAESESYDFGCETKTVMSKMISRPDDLMGKAGTEDEDSSRHGVLLQNYQTGVPNEKMDSVNASEVGN